MKAMDEEEVDGPPQAQHNTTGQEDHDDSYHNDDNLEHIHEDEEDPELESRMLAALENSHNESLTTGQLGGDQLLAISRNDSRVSLVSVEVTPPSASSLSSSRVAQINSSPDTNRKSTATLSRGSSKQSMARALIAVSKLSQLSKTSAVSVLQPVQKDDFDDEDIERYIDEDDDRGGGYRFETPDLEQVLF